MPDERRVQLKREVRSRNRRMHREDVSSGPCARRLAFDGRPIDRQVKVDPSSWAHALHGSASIRPYGREPAVAQLDAIDHLACVSELVRSVALAGPVWLEEVDVPRRTRSSAAPPIPGERLVALAIVRPAPTA